MVEICDWKTIIILSTHLNFITGGFMSSFDSVVDMRTIQCDEMTFSIVTNLRFSRTIILMKMRNTQEDLTAENQECHLETIIGRLPRKIEIIQAITTLKWK